MATAGQPLLQLDGVNTYYGPIHILQDVNLVVYPGEMVCLLGGNACGKSTTLQTILEFIKDIQRQGATLLLVEQNANMALEAADSGYVLQTGRVVLADKAKNLMNNEQMRAAYLGQ